MTSQTPPQQDATALNEAAALFNDEDEEATNLPERIRQMEQAADEARERMEEEVRRVEEEVRKLPFVSEIAELVDDSTSYMQRVGMRRADELTATAASKMINSMGATMLNALHDHAMPKGMHQLVDDVYGNLWPEMKKTMMDSVMLSASLEFGSVRQKQISEAQEPKPSGPLLRRMAARLIYAMEPYDLTFWGTIRSPLSLAIQLLFYFPFYGISDLCVLTLAAAKAYTNFNSYGLIQFIVSSKRLQFITSGLMSGTYAFTKLFVCATYRDTRDPTLPGWEPSYFECPTFAPGTHRTFIFEFCLFVTRSVLNWCVFYVLWNFETVQTVRESTGLLAAQQRLRSGAERRGLHSLPLQRCLLLLTWTCACIVMWQLIFAAEEDVDHDWLGYHDVVLLTLTLQMMTHRLISQPCMRAWPSRAGAIASMLVALYIAAVRLPPVPGTPLLKAWDALTRLEWSAFHVHVIAVIDAGTPLQPLTLELLLCACSAGIHLSLFALQHTAIRQDEAAVKRLEMLLANADPDGEGLTRAEARQKYHLFLLDSAAALAAEAGVPPVPGEAALFQARERAGALTSASRLSQDAKHKYGWGYVGKPGAQDETQIALAEEAVEGCKTFEEFWAEVDPGKDGKIDLKDLKAYYGIAHEKEDNPKDTEVKLDDPNYVEKRLEELHQWEFGKTKSRPGGALIYWVIWDLCAFSISVLTIVPFLLREATFVMNEEDGTDFGDVLEDWRVRCALYFLKVFIAMLSFPFLVFALPLAQDWLTHVKASGYDKAANCVQKYSSSQIKAKFRHLYNEEKKRRAKNPSTRSDKVQDCWDRFIGVDAEKEMRMESLEEAEAQRDPTKKGQALSVVEAAEMRRRQQARHDFGDEATLMVFERDKTGELRLQGDPSSLMML